MNNVSRFSALGLGAVAALVASISIASAVFFTAPQSTMNCGGYGYQAGYGYGYDCSPKSSWSTGGGSTGATPATTNGTTPAPTVTLFPQFVKACGNEATSLTDAKVTAFYDVLKIQNRVNAESRNLTRAEFLKLTLNAAGVDVTKETAPNYSDVPADHTLANYIAYATRTNIVSGQDGKFRPNDSISRGEAMKILVNSTKAAHATSSTTFTDVPASYSLANYVQSAKDACIVQGATATTFEPLRGITVAETAKVLYNIANTK